MDQNDIWTKLVGVNCIFANFLPLRNTSYHCPRTPLHPFQFPEWPILTKHLLSHLLPFSYSPSGKGPSKLLFRYFYWIWIL